MGKLYPESLALDRFQFCVVQMVDYGKPMKQIDPEIIELRKEIGSFKG